MTTNPDLYNLNSSAYIREACEFVTARNTLILFYKHDTVPSIESIRELIVYIDGLGINDERPIVNTVHHLLAKNGLSLRIGSIANIDRICIEYDRLILDGYIRPYILSEEFSNGMNCATWASLTSSLLDEEPTDIISNYSQFKQRLKEVTKSHDWFIFYGLPVGQLIDIAKLMGNRYKLLDNRHSLSRSTLSEYGQNTIILHDDVRISKTANGNVVIYDDYDYIVCIDRLNCKFVYVTDKMTREEIQNWKVYRTSQYELKVIKFDKPAPPIVIHTFAEF